jgi:hypothetical protein
MVPSEPDLDGVVAAGCLDELSDYAGEGSSQETLYATQAAVTLSTGMI